MSHNNSNNNTAKYSSSRTSNVIFPAKIAENSTWEVVKSEAATLGEIKKNYLKHAHFIIIY